MTGFREFKIVTRSPGETKDLAGRLAPNLLRGDVISLVGDLGAGKTVFVQGLAESLGVRERVTSPTFTIIKEYSNGFRLYHFDVYRLESPAELVDLGYEEYFYDDGVSVIEWGNRMASLFPPEYLEIQFELAGEDKREVTFTPKGRRWEEVLGKLFSGLKKEVE
ncbi:MAG: tRNA (adenosine(37)-N6)-threonylcarbamoyltransferase complex ATPase subunit type 1 TsaE [Actinobacteria bacterium]|nr:tRNA (adenosine(37)-N6)-threonylcarbamoyltransferase complex ATPase subunit type 1 TsaE [Actinomycetota bacterium]